VTRQAGAEQKGERELYDLSASGNASKLDARAFINRKEEKDEH
jgi:hypothetical protein